MSIQFTGQIRKMATEWGQPIQYYLVLGDSFVSMNQLIGKKIKVNHLRFQCLNCQKDLPVYRMGYCKSCFFKVPQTSESIIRPELSRAHLGEAERDLAWEQAFQLQPHLVYLANSAGLKVGVTRKKQVPYRWIDQGAHEAICLAETENRYQAGQIEVELKAHLADKTPWQRMLKDQNPVLDLVEKKKEVASLLSKEMQTFVSDDDTVTQMHYPVTAYPTKIKSINLNKQAEFTGVLSGIKGQYLLLTDQHVFNVRSHEGFVISLTLETE